MVKLEDVLVKTDDECFSSGTGPLPVCIWEMFRSHWLIKFLNIFMRKKGIDICVYFFPSCV